MSPFVAAERRRGRGRGRSAIRGRSRRGSSGPEAPQQEQNLDGVPLDAATLLSQPRVCPPAQVHFAMIRSKAVLPEVPVRRLLPNAEGSLAETCDV